MPSLANTHLMSGQEGISERDGRRRRRSLGVDVPEVQLRRGRLSVADEAFHRSLMAKVDGV